MKLFEIKLKVVDYADNHKISPASMLKALQKIKEDEEFHEMLDFFEKEIEAIEHVIRLYEENPSTTDFRRAIMLTDWNESVLNSAANRGIPVDPQKTFVIINKCYELTFSPDYLHREEEKPTIH